MTNPFDYQPAYRRNLPHFQPEGAIFFVTTRLAGSLPLEAIERLQEQRRVNRQAVEHMVAPPELKQALWYDEDKRYFGRFDRLLDGATAGPLWLSEPRVAELVCEAIRRHDGRLYDLIAYCLMPNHAHLIFTPQPRPDGRYYALAWIMQRLKGGTAYQANQLLGRRGAFWQHESYDHTVRDGRELERIVAYVLQNPVKAGLAAAWDEWPWTYWKDAHL